jgi:hypothetical protein
MPHSASPPPTSTRRLGERLGRTSKVDNTSAALPAKVQIRRLVLLDAIGAERAHVFDVFAGGVLYRRVWHQAANYVGCDLKRDQSALHAHTQTMGTSSNVD